MTKEIPAGYNEHFKGPKNWFIRQYTYCTRGMDIVNIFRNLFFLIGMGALAFHCKDPIILFFVFCGSMGLLRMAGWASVHHMAKVVDWLNMYYSTYYQKQSFRWQEEQVELLKAILKELQDARRNTSDPGCDSGFIRKDT